MFQENLLDGELHQWKRLNTKNEEEERKNESKRFEMPAYRVRTMLKLTADQIITH